MKSKLWWNHPKITDCAPLRLRLCVISDFRCCFIFAQQSSACTAMRIYISGVWWMRVCAAELFWITFTAGVRKELDFFVFISLLAHTGCEYMCENGFGERWSETMTQRKNMEKVKTFGVFIGVCYSGAVWLPDLNVIKMRYANYILCTSLFHVIIA